MRATLVLFVLLLPGCVSPQASGPAAQVSGGQQPLSCADPCGTRLLEADFGLREPILAIDPTDAKHAIALSMGIAFDPAVGLTGRYELTRHETQDGGATWTRETLPPPTLDGAPTTAAYDPALAFLPDGTPVIGGVALVNTLSVAGMAQAAPRVFAQRAEAAVVVDAGQGAEVFSAVAGAVALRAPDKPALMATPDGTLVMVYTVRERATPADPMSARVAVARSDDGGASWAPVPTWDQEANGLAGQPVAIAQDRWGVPFATFESIETRDELECGVAMTDDGGASWSLAQLGPCAFLATLAVHGDEIHAALPRPGERGTDVALLAWDGAAFRDALVVDVGETKGESIPTVVARDDGSLLVTYFHAVAGGKTSYRMALVREATIVASLTLDEEMTRTPTQMGEYFGLAPTPEGALATWIHDTEDGGVAVVAATLLIA